MNARPLVPALLVGIVLVAAVSLVSRAGSLTPPPGPVEPTGPTPLSPTTTPGGPLAVYSITAPGSYYLTDNVLGTGALGGIHIAVGNVDLDLRGFSVIGLGTGQGTGIDAANRDVTVHDGFVEKWNIGVGFTGDRKTIRNVVVSDCTGATGTGIAVGTRSLILNCIAQDNDGIGISVGRWSCIVNSIATGNATGINTYGGVVRGCVSDVNTTNLNDPNGDTVVADSFIP